MDGVLGIYAFYSMFNILTFILYANNNFNLIYGQEFNLFSNARPYTLLLFQKRNGTSNLRRIKKESGTLNMKHASVQGETSVKHYCKIFVNYFNISFLFELNRDISMSFCLNWTHFSLIEAKVTNWIIQKSKS